MHAKPKKKTNTKKNSRQRLQLFASLTTDKKSKISLHSVYNQLSEKLGYAYFLYMPAVIHYGLV